MDTKFVEIGPVSRIHYANSVNFGLDPKDFLALLPSERIHAVHISGGKWIHNGDLSQQRILDDHLHDPPDPVYDLLTDLAARCPNPLTVVLERDGAYPSIDHLLAQLDRARQALEFGRATQPDMSAPLRPLPLMETPGVGSPGRMRGVT